jgi:hypothetical protein
VCNTLASLEEAPRECAVLGCSPVLAGALLTLSWAFCEESIRKADANLTKGRKQAK